MRPPICDVCDRRAADDENFALVTFADHQPLQGDLPGHPDGLHWLCPTHTAALADLTDRTWADALAVHRTRVAEG